MKLTEKQFKAAQIFWGIVAGAGIWLAIWVGGQYPDNQVLSFLFLAVFLAALLIQRHVEKKLEMRLKLYFKTYLFSLIGGLAAFLIYGLASGQFVS